MKLISMTDFILEQQIYYNEKALQAEWGDNSRIGFTDKIIRYTKFLKQPLELWMFVPCDEDGNVLEDCDCLSDNGCCVKRNEYNKAKERVLFDGVTIETHIVNGDVNLTSIIIQEKTVFTYDTYIHTGEVFKEHKNKIIEHLPVGIKLTQTAIKQIMS